MPSILKINCDLGEGFPNDELIMPYIDQANIACGYHAGNHTTMSTSIRLAKTHKVELGAHPSYLDHQSFGRKSIKLTEQEIIDLVAYQVGALKGIALTHSYDIKYIKPHGALYNDMMKCDKTFHALCQVASIFDLPLMILAKADNSREHQIAQRFSVKLLYEAFADRRYDVSGQLVPRSESNASLTKIDDVIAQINTLCLEGAVVASNSEKIMITANTLCIHGDNSNSDKVAKAIREHLKKER